MLSHIVRRAAVPSCGGRMKTSQTSEARALVSARAPGMKLPIGAAKLPQHIEEAARVPCQPVGELIMEIASAQRASNGTMKRTRGWPSGMNDRPPLPGSGSDMSAMSCPCLAFNGKKKNKSTGPADADPTSTPVQTHLSEVKTPMVEGIGRQGKDWNCFTGKCL